VILHNQEFLIPVGLNTKSLKHRLTALEILVLRRSISRLLQKMRKRALMPEDYREIGIGIKKKNHNQNQSQNLKLSKRKQL
jgi:hypothetical protein